MRAGCGIVAVVAVLLIIVAAALGSSEEDDPASAPTSTPAPDRAEISRATMGEAWPFTVESGRLACKSLGGSVGAVTFTTGNTTYALNGIARTSGQYADGFEIQRFDSSGVASGDLNAVIARGLDLCK